MDFNTSKMNLGPETRPDRYPSGYFPPAPYAEYPKAVYLDAPHLGGTLRAEGLDHVQHKMPVLALSSEHEQQLREMDAKWAAEQPKRRGRPPRSLQDVQSDDPDQGDPSLDNPPD